MFYEFFVSYLTLVIDFLKDRGSEEQILRDLTLAIPRAIARIHREAFTVNEQYGLKPALG